MALKFKTLEETIDILKDMMKKGTVKDFQISVDIHDQPGIEVTTFIDNTPQFLPPLLHGYDRGEFDPARYLVDLDPDPIIDSDTGKGICPYCSQWIPKYNHCPYCGAPYKST